MIKMMLGKVMEIYKRYEEIINYLIVGFLTVVITYVSYSFCALFFDPSNAFLLQVDNILSWIIAVIFAYFCNRKYVFKSKNRNKKKEFISFISSRLLTLLLDMFVMFFLVTILLINDSISKMVSQVLVIIVNYVLSKVIVFKR